MTSTTNIDRVNQSDNSNNSNAFVQNFANLSDTELCLYLTRNFYFKGAGKSRLATNPDGECRTWDVQRLSKVDQRLYTPDHVSVHVKGEPAGNVVTNTTTHVAHITIDMDRHSADIPLSTHRDDCLFVHAYLTTHWSQFVWIPEINPNNASLHFAAHRRNLDTFPIDKATEIAEQIHNDIVPIVGATEVFPFNKKQMRLPCRNDKLTLTENAVMATINTRFKKIDSKRVYKQTYSMHALVDHITNGNQTNRDFLKATIEQCSSIFAEKPKPKFKPTPKFTFVASNDLTTRQIAELPLGTLQMALDNGNDPEKLVLPIDFRRPKKTVKKTNGTANAKTIVSKTVDVVQTNVKATKKTVRRFVSKSLPNVSPSLIVKSHRDQNPDSHKRQLAYCLQLCRDNKRIVSTEEALYAIRETGNFTGDWNDNFDKRAIRVAGILDYISQTFDLTKCQSQNKKCQFKDFNWQTYERPAHKHFKDGARDINHGKVLLDGTIKTRASYSEIATAQTMTVAMMIIHICCLIWTNPDGSTSRDKGFKVVWNWCYRHGIIKQAWSNNLWCVVVNNLIDIGFCERDFRYCIGSADTHRILTPIIKKSEPQKAVNNEILADNNCVGSDCDKKEREREGKGHKYSVCLTENFFDFESLEIESLPPP